MKRIALVMMIAVVCLCVSGVTRGDDNPLLGKWKLNVEKSKMTPASMLPKAQSRVVEADGDSVKYSYENTKADGTTSTYGFTVKFDGKDYEVTGSGAPFGADHVAIKKVSARSYSATLKKGDKVVGTSRVVISADGKTTTLTQKGTDDKGQAASGTLIYEKE
jgi:hypothetical protein